MGLDAGFEKIKSKVNSFEEYKKLRKKAIELSEDDFYKWESSVLYTDRWFVHRFINRLPHSVNVDYDDAEDMIIKKCHLQFLINELKRKLKTYKGLKEINNINNYIINSKEIMKHYDRKWWKDNLLKPLEKLLKEIDFNNETLFYGAWF